MRAQIVLLPGDGIGPEIVREAQACLALIAQTFGHDFIFAKHPIGGAAIKLGLPALSEKTLEACRCADAVLLGAVGDPVFDDLPLDSRPEGGLLQLRQGLELYANLRPVRVPSGRAFASPLAQERVSGTDLVFVRELAGGIYFGKPRWKSADSALNTLTYTVEEIERVARVAFELARRRKKRLTSVDKANVLETSQLWRSVVNAMAGSYPEVEVEHLYVDACAMALVTSPTRFDVLLTDNLFGDILSDEAAVLTGSLGMLPSASLGHGVSLFEPIHGSAPTIAGKDLANPIGTILSGAMLLRHALSMEEEASLLEEAVERALAEGYGTPELAGVKKPCSTSEMGAVIREYMDILVAAR